MVRRSLIVLAGVAVALAACTSGTTTQSVRQQASGCNKDSLPLFKEGQLTISTSNPAFPPWVVGPAPGSEWKGNAPESGKGFESAVAYAVAQELGFTEDEVVWVAEPFNKTYAPGPKNYDFSIQQISITPKRAQAVEFSDGYYEVNQALIGLKDSPAADATSVADLAPLKFGAQIGTTGLEFIETVIQPDQEAFVYDDTNAAKTALENGQIDALVVDLPTAFFITAVEIPKAKVIGQFESSTGEPEEFGLTFEKGSELVECVNQAIQALNADGSLDRIQEEWLSTTVEVPVLT